MPLPKFIRRLSRQRSEADRLTQRWQRQSKLCAIGGEDAPWSHDETGKEPMREIRDLYGIDGRGRC